MTGDNFVSKPKQDWQLKEEEDALSRARLIPLCVTIIIMVILILMFSCTKAQAQNMPCPAKIADAIYLAEGGAKTRHPYGILTKYKTTTPRQACINTINSALKRFAKQNEEKDFIVFLSKTYCPVGAKNDPTGLNKNWVKNVKYFLERTN